MKQILTYLKDLYERFVTLLGKLRRDRLYHFIAGLLIAALFGITFKMRAWAFFVALGIGVAKECVDKFVEKEEFDWGDLIATALGGGYISLCFLLMLA